MASFFELAGNVGSSPEDTNDLRLLKTLGVLWAVSMSTAGWIWGAIYYLFDEPIAALFPWGYCVLAYVGIGLFAVTKLFSILRLTQTLISIFVPFLLGLYLGGFALSGAVVLWSLVGPIGALVLYDKRIALRWFILYIVLILVSLAFEGNLRTENNLPGWLINAFFVMNILGTSIVGYTVLYFFVREKDRAFLAVQSAQSQLIQAEKMSSLGQLTAGIAHEIKNPLNFINNFAKLSVQLADEIVEELGQANPSLSEAIGDLAANSNRIHEHGTRIDGIVSNMMEHARLSGGKRAATNINELTESYTRLVFSGMEATDGDAEVSLEIESTPDLPPINIVGKDLGRVVQNLVTNAIDEVIRQHVDHPTVRVSTKRVEDHIEIWVSDNGSGVPDRIRDKIFEPFFTTKPTGEGTGLGLSLSYDTVKESLGGDLRLGESELGGATFVVSLGIR